MENPVKKIVSLVSVAAGIIMSVFALYLDITKSNVDYRGALLIIGVLAILFGVYMYPTIKHQKVINFLFLFPLVFTFLCTVMIPFVCGIFYSMTDWNGVKYSTFVGLENFVTMFTSRDYLYSVVVTFLFTVFNMILVNILGFTMALLCTAKLKGEYFYRAAFFLPNLIGGIVLGYVWQFIFNKVFVTIFGGNSMLADPNQAFIGIVIVSVWQYAGYIMMIYVTGIQTLPKDVIEAAKVDGANKITTLFKIKIPMIWNTFTVCIFLTLISAFNQFDVNMALTNGAPSRIMGNNIYLSTEFLALNIYNTAIVKNKYALGQTKAIIFFIILAIVSLTQVSLSKKREVEM